MIDEINLKKNAENGTQGKHQSFSTSTLPLGQKARQQSLAPKLVMQALEEIKENKRIEETSEMESVATS